MKRMSLMMVSIIGISLMIVPWALAGSIIVTNNTDTDCQVCRAGGHARCWTVPPGATDGPTYVQDDRAFWFDKAADGSENVSRSYSVTDNNERYTIFRVLDNPKQINMMYMGSYKSSEEKGKQKEGKLISEEKPN